jgi:hypothetical protein
MQERRRQPRDRVYYGGMVTFNDRTSNIACVVRNFSMFGARIEFEGAALVPDKVDFELRRKSISCLAHMVWRDRDAAGLVFAHAHETDGVVPLDFARKLRASERTNRQLQRRIEQLRSEH